MNKLDSMTSGADYQFADKMQRPSFPSSVFDLSHTLNMSFPVGSVGALIPIACFETVPSDRFNISVSHLLRVLPQVVPLYSSARIYIHAFYSRSSDLWTGAQVYYRKGNNGNRILKKPVLTTSNCGLLKTGSVTQPSNEFIGLPEYIGSNELLHYLYGLPVGSRRASFDGKLNALPYFMYFKIWRDYFCNKYFYQDDEILLPDDESSFRLNNNGIVNCFATQPYRWNDVYTFYLNSVSLPFNEYGFYYRDYADDRFTASMPSPQRGDAPAINFEGLIKGYKLNNGSTVGDELGSLLYVVNNKNQKAISFPAFLNSNNNINMAAGVYNHDAENHVWKENRVPTSLNDGDRVGFRPEIKILLNDLRQLAINQQELEKMARTDGSYSEFGLTFFGVSSKSSFDYRPIYIGGTWQPIVFTEVVQTSGTAQGAGVLGQYAGHGISSNNGNIGSVYCDDYGYIMILASIVPDTLYSQGIEKQFTRLFQADELLPERAKLGAQPVLNKEIYWQGNSQDDELFAYQDIMDEFRYSMSRVRGELSNPRAEMYFPYTQSRFFNNLPTYSQSFATTQGNVRMDFLTSQADPPFTAQFRFNIRAVRPLPYKSVPANLI